MSFEWTDYLNFAQELTSYFPSSPNQEALLRSAISRAYYAAFCEARNYLIYKDGQAISDGKENVHRYVLNTFKGSRDPTRKKIAEWLYHLRGLRNNADYEDIVYGDLHGKAIAALWQAKQVLRLLASL